MIRVSAVRAGAMFEARREVEKLALPGDLCNFTYFDPANCALHLGRSDFHRGGVELSTADHRLARAFIVIHRNTPDIHRARVVR